MTISRVFYTLIEDKSVVFHSAEFQPECVIFHAHLRRNMMQCPVCHSRHVRIKETKERTFRMPNLSKRRSYLRVSTHKLWCQDCGLKAWMQLPFTSGKLPMTKSFISYVRHLTAISTLVSVARSLGLNWRTVKNIDKENLKLRAKQFSFKKLRYISIDEIAIKKGHKYMTIFTDILTGQIIHAVEGRKEEAIRPFLKLLSIKSKRLRAIGIDMSVAYTSAIKMHLPQVLIVFDRFHVSKLLNEMIDKVRRVEYAKCQDNGMQVLKGQRFLLLRNFKDLDNKQKSSLQQLLEINQSIAVAHSMKEQFRLFWDQDSKNAGARYLGSWIIQAIESDIGPLAKTARTLLYNYEGLLSYFDHGIDNGKAEGINNKIKVLKRQAYGFQDQEYFKLKLYHLHKKEYELVG